MAQDVFPDTLKTWINQEIQRDRLGRQNLNRYLMGTYAEPLKVYFMGTNSRWLGEPDDVVDGFFASRLSHDDFMAKWQASGMRLRRWLMNAFSYYLMELRRERSSSKHNSDLTHEPVTFTGDPDRAVDQAAVIAFVRQAMQQAEETCKAEGLEKHWQVFVRHHIENADFRLIAGEFKIEPSRAAVMSRTAGRKFRNALRDVLMNDGVAPEDIDEEIQGLLR
jgi:hypothetical protein